VGQFKKILSDASSLIQSLRNIGYSFETAVADIINNSITAKAKNIDIFFQNNNNRLQFAILDDKIGMSEEELFNAMKPGNINSLDLRNETNLRRFSPR